MGTSEPAVRVERLRVVRGGRVALRDVSLAVERGTVTGLLGPSGSGKSTLMRALVGVQVVQGGTVEVLGEPAGSPGLRARVGYVTQAPSVYRDLSVRENLAYSRACSASLEAGSTPCSGRSGSRRRQTGSCGGSPAVRSRASRLRRRS